MRSGKLLLSDAGMPLQREEGDPLALSTARC